MDDEHPYYQGEHSSILHIILQLTTQRNGKQQVPEEVHLYQILYMLFFVFVFGSTHKYQTLYQLSSNLCKMAQSIYVFKVVLFANLHEH